MPHTSEESLNKFQQQAELEACPAGSSKADTAMPVGKKRRGHPGTLGMMLQLDFQLARTLVFHKQYKSMPAGFFFPIKMAEHTCKCNVINSTQCLKQLMVFVLNYKLMRNQIKKDEDF